MSLRWNLQAYCPKHGILGLGRDSETGEISVNAFCPDCMGKVETYPPIAALQSKLEAAEGRERGLRKALEELISQVYDGDHTVKPPRLAGVGKALEALANSQIVALSTECPACKGVDYGVLGAGHECPACQGETIPDGYNAGRFVHEEGCGQSPQKEGT